MSRLVDLVLDDDAEVLLLGGVVDEGGGGQVSVLVLQLPVQGWGEVSIGATLHVSVSITGRIIGGFNRSSPMWLLSRMMSAALKVAT